MTDIRNCKFTYRCTQRWADLEAVPGTMRVRFCTRCQSAVHRADGEGEFDELARQGKCVAVFQDDAPLELTGKPAVSQYVPKLRIVK
jgi:hypothetical protein